MNSSPVQVAHGEGDTRPFDRSAAVKEAHVVIAAWLQRGRSETCTYATKPVLVGHHLSATCFRQRPDLVAGGPVRSRSPCRVITLDIDTGIADRMDGSMTSDGRSDNSREPGEPSERAVHIEVVYDPDFGVIAEVTRADGRRFCGIDPG